MALSELLRSTISMKQAPIGIFDSGLGGLSVLRHIRQQCPNESLHYFADAGFAPYGDKTEDAIIQRTLFVAAYFFKQGVKAMVVACNTATTVAIKQLRARYPDLILIGVEPGLKPAASLSKTGCVGVLATSRTLASEKYQQLSQQIQQAVNVRFIHQACPGLVTQIELGELESQTTLALLNKYLEPIFASQADAIVLGCTHYPFVASSIKRIAQQKNKQHIQLIDTGAAIAQQLQRLLEKHQLANRHKASRTIHCTTSGNVNQLKFALTQLLHFQPKNYVIAEIGGIEIGCNSPAS